MINKTLQCITFLAKDDSVKCNKFLKFPDPKVKGKAITFDENDINELAILTMHPSITRYISLPLEKILVPLMRGRSCLISILMIFRKFQNSSMKLKMVTSCSLLPGFHSAATTSSTSGPTSPLSGNSPSPSWSRCHLSHFTTSLQTSTSRLPDGKI